MRATNTFLPRKERESIHEKQSKLDMPETRSTRTSFGDFGGNDRMRNTKSILYIVLAFLAMAYTGLTFVTSILAYRATSERTWHISQMVDNWK